MPVFWPGEFHGLYSPCGCKDSDTTERLLLSPCFYSYILFFFRSSVFRFKDFFSSAMLNLLFNLSSESLIAVPFYLFVYRSCI